MADVKERTEPNVEAPTDEKVLEALQLVRDMRELGLRRHTYNLESPHHRRVGPDEQ